MKSVLSVDVANGKSVVLLITEHGEVLIEPYEVKHCLSDFNSLKNKIDTFKILPNFILLHFPSYCVSKNSEMTKLGVRAVNSENKL